MMREATAMSTRQRVYGTCMYGRREWLATLGSVASKVLSTICIDATHWQLDLRLLCLHDDHSRDKS